MSRRANRAAKERLVNIAESYMQPFDPGEDLRLVPTCMADLQNQRIAAKKPHQLLDISAILIRALERYRKLREQGAQHVFRRKGVVSSLGFALVRLGGPNGFRRGRLQNGHRGMCEAAVQF